MKIGVYVGSFDPVHLGHVEITNYLLSNKILDKVIIIPTGNYWDKNDLSDIQNRVEMLNIFENDKIIIDSKLSKYQYTYEILNELKNQHSNATLYLIIGADNLKKFHLWRNIEVILQNKIIVINRNGIKAIKYINKFSNKKAFLVINGFEELNISSSEIRKRIKSNKNVSSLLDRRVINYICENNLYGGK